MSQLQLEHARDRDAAQPCPPEPKVTMFIAPCFVPVHCAHMHARAPDRTRTRGGSARHAIDSRTTWAYTSMELPDFVLSSRTRHELGVLFTRVTVQHSP
jgi:hypothetical protein